MTDAAQRWHERRAETREPTNARGRVMHGPNLGIWADCTIKDLSATGAKIELSHVYTLPPRFILIHFPGAIAYEVVLKWRRGDLAGMSFEHRHDLTQPVEPRLEAVQQTWAALK